ncbi:unnamed protein product, partial [Gongylonema pulchrum]|uniref:Secreted protein n=1 Tax=Gongylonema pulchrum TaxID=637853 RepID=A0A183DE85_9BILA
MIAPETLVRTAAWVSNLFTVHAADLTTAFAVKHRDCQEGSGSQINPVTNSGCWSAATALPGAGAGSVKKEEPDEQPLHNNNFCRSCE